MTGDDLRAVPTWVDWRGNPPKVTIPAATRDALADLCDEFDRLRALVVWLHPDFPDETTRRGLDRDGLLDTLIDTLEAHRD